jgi:hypothetical protein
MLISQTKPIKNRFNHLIINTKHNFVKENLEADSIFQRAEEKPNVSFLATLNLI